MSLPDLPALRGKRVLVTGGTGLIGREVVRMLADLGASVTTVSLDKAPPGHPAYHHQGDLCWPNFQLKFLLRIIREQDCCFHLAGMTGSPTWTTSHPASFMVPILQMNTFVLEACRLAHVGRVVYASTIGAYPRRLDPLGEVLAWSGLPQDLYPGWAKRTGEVQIEAYREEYHLEWVSVRLTNTYGPGGVFDPDRSMVVPALLAKALRGDDPVVVAGDGHEVRDFLFSRDAAAGLLAAMQSNLGLVNIGSGRGVTIRELVDTMARVTGRRFVCDPIRTIGSPYRVLDISLAREKLGWAPQASLEAGLTETWEWLISKEQKESHESH